jgi:hypothetical protein
MKSNGLYRKGRKETQRGSGIRPNPESSSILESSGAVPSPAPLPAIGYEGGNGKQKETVLSQHWARGIRDGILRGMDRRDRRDRRHRRDRA